MTSGRLFDPLPPVMPTALPYNGTAGYNRGSDTSTEAARLAASSGSATKMQYRLIALLYQVGPAGLTSDECEALLNERHQSVSANLRAMEIACLPDVGPVFTTTEKRRTRSGRKAHPYVLRDFDGQPGVVRRSPTPPARGSGSRSR